MRNSLILVGLLLAAFALYAIWESLTARIVAVESATGSYIYSETEEGEVIFSSAPDVDMDELYDQLETLENAVSANAEVLGTILQQLERIDDKNAALENAVNENGEAIETLSRRLGRIEDKDTKAVSKALSRETVFFEHDDNTLAPGETAKIDEVLAGIADNAIVSLRGHADAVGDNDYNYHLSVRRAAAVKRYMEDKLRAAGRIDAVLITVDGIGEEGGVNVTADGVEEPANRVVEILVFDRTATE
jgi:outer membrane protein OmpA-like peptidoglycan-associated protein